MPSDDMRWRIARALFVVGVGAESASAWDSPGEWGRARWYAYADVILPLVEEAVAAERAKSEHAVDEILLAAERAVAAERERAATIAISMAENEPDGYYGQACHEVAAAIREGDR